ncbi:MAG: carbon-nitrogen hydrolase family protein [Lentisphaerae bacterium]|nr:carbon-nitrogen hydrolase family protein [Lentisphaerota bacterium]
MNMVLATCQFPVQGTVARNARYILGQMRTAARRGAHVVHFPETALTGYPGLDMPGFEAYDWTPHAAAVRAVMREARALKVWVILGSSHPLTGTHKPHNCLYIINDRGRLVDRYDKRFCTGDAAGRTGDLKHFAPGNHATVFRIRGMVCGALICHDMRYPELYRDYARIGVRVMFHSYHNAHWDPAKVRRRNLHGFIVPATMQAFAACNAMWISAANSSRTACAWPSFIVQPDGAIAGQLTLERAGVLLTRIDPLRTYYDASERWRSRALRGVLNSGRLVRDARSRERRRL